jgi:segregation and condensation protein A
MTEPMPPESPGEGVAEPTPAPVPAAVATVPAPVPPGAEVHPYRIELPVFEGPLDLLLHLIEDHELDIFDIPIAFVATKFVETIMLMQELNIDVASEYLVMAATLAHIKSKLLLPAVPDDQEVEPEPELDPRAELVRRLLEYQKYKQVAEQLGGNSVLGRDVFLRGVPAPDAEGPAPIAGLSLFKLLDAFQSVLLRVKATFEHEVSSEHFSITDRINELSELLQKRRRIPFVELFDGQTTRSDLITTFLALLEMTRLRLTLLFQDDPLGPIEIELAVHDGEPAATPPETALDARSSAEVETEAELAAAPDAVPEPEADIDLGNDGETTG